MEEITGVEIFSNARGQRIEVISTTKFISLNSLLLYNEAHDFKQFTSPEDSTVFILSLITLNDRGFVSDIESTIYLKINILSY